MTIRLTALLCLLSLFLFQSCNKDEEEMPAPPEENPMATDINAYIRSLTPLIVENAVYSRENPGLPIAYRVNLLSDNRIVKMGFSSDYTDVRCGKIAYNHPRIDFYNDFDTYNLRIKLTYDHDYPPADDTGETTELQINDESSATLPDVPDGAFDVRMIVRRIDGFTWREWETRNLYHISSSQNEDCWRAYRGGFSTGFATFLEKCD